MHKATQRGSWPTSHSKLCIGLLYRPPSSPASVFETLSSHLLDVSVSSFPNFVLLGDFNVDYNNLSHPLFSNLCNNIVNTFSLTQVVPGYTHSGPSGTCSLIDLVFISCQSNLCSCSTISPLGTSDHCGVDVSVKWKLPNLLKTHPRNIWRYAHADFVGIGMAAILETSHLLLVGWIWSRSQTLSSCTYMELSDA